MCYLHITPKTGQMIFQLGLWTSGLEANSRLLCHDPPWALESRNNYYYISENFKNFIFLRYYFLFADNTFLTQLLVLIFISNFSAI